MITAATTVPFLAADLATSMEGWMNGLAEPLSGIARLTLDLAPTGATVVTTAPGPLTLALAARAAAHPASRPQLAVDALVAWMVGRRDDIAHLRPDVDIVVVLDEPALSAFAPDRPDAERYRPVAVDALVEVVATAPLDIAIRYEEDTDWSVVAAAGPRYVAWNVGALGVRFDEHTDAVARAIGSGMGVMWGVAGVGPSPVGSDGVAISRYRTALARLVVAGAPLAQIRDDAWFIPNGSMERLSVERARRVMEQVADVAGAIDD